MRILLILKRLLPILILHDVNININRGETVAILGPSGSGKSTLLGLLAGLDEPSSGQIDIDGQNLNKLNEDGKALLRSKTIGFVFQSFQLLNSLNALENVMLPLELTHQKHPRQLAKTWLERVGLTERLTHYPHQLSGGEQQRVAIARAFACEPKLLLADEPTGNLDKQTAKNVINILFELNTSSKTTLLIVTHDDNLANRCQRQLILDNGHLQ